MKKLIIQFDSHCKLCSKFIRLLANADKNRSLEFSPLETERADSLGLQSIRFLEGDRISLKSTAILRAALYLPFPYRFFSVLLVVPLFARDGLYDFVAKNRYRWFGRCDHCAGR